MSEEKKKYPKVDFLDNLPVTVTFLFDKPKTGIAKSKTDNSEYMWYLYACKEKEIDKSFFATELLHKTLILAKVGKGTTATITLKQRSDDKKRRFWEIILANGNAVTSDSLDAVRTGAQVEQIQKQEQKTKDYYNELDNLINLYESIYVRLQANGKVGALDIQPATASLFIVATRNNVKPGVKPLVKNIDDDIPPPDDDDTPGMFESVPH